MKYAVHFNGERRKKKKKKKEKGIDCYLDFRTYRVEVGGSLCR